MHWDVHHQIVFIENPIPRTDGALLRLRCVITVLSIRVNNMGPKLSIAEAKKYSLDKWTVVLSILENMLKVPIQNKKEREEYWNTLADKIDRICGFCQRWRGDGFGQMHCESCELFPDICDVDCVENDWSIFTQIDEKISSQDGRGLRGLIKRMIQGIEEVEDE